jgi:hypothetical protein
MKAYGGMYVYIHIFLASALVGGEWSASRPGHSMSRESAPATHWLGGWLDDMEKRKIFNLPGFELRPVSRPARSQSLFQLRYRGSSGNQLPV